MNETNEINEPQNNSSNYTSTNQYVPNDIGSGKNNLDTQKPAPEQNEEKETATEIVKATTSKKSKDISKLLTTVVTVVSASMIGVVGVEDILPKATIEAKFENVYATEHEVYYSAFYEMLGREDKEYNEEDYYNIYIVLYNDFTNRSEKFEDNYADGSFENLKENMTYTLEIRQGDIVVASTTITTTGRQGQTSDDPTTGNTTNP